MRIRPTSFDALRTARSVLVTPPADEPVTLEEAKRHVRRFDATDDELIEHLITAARQKVEVDTGRALVTQVHDVWLDAFPDGPILLPNGLLRSVDEITVYDGGNVESTLDTSLYWVDTASSPGRIVLSNGIGWPTVTRQANVVKIRATFGYGEPDDVPAPLKHAMLLVIGAMYEHREQVIVSQFAGQFIALPFGYDQLIGPYVLGGV